MRWTISPAHFIERIFGAGAYCFDRMATRQCHEISLRRAPTNAAEREDDLNHETRVFAAGEVN